MEHTTSKREISSTTHGEWQTNKKVLYYTVSCRHHDRGQLVRMWIRRAACVLFPYTKYPKIYSEVLLSLWWGFILRIHAYPFYPLFCHSYPFVIILLQCSWYLLIPSLSPRILSPLPVSASDTSIWRPRLSTHYLLYILTSSSLYCSIVIDYYKNIQSVQVIQRDRVYILFHKRALQNRRL